MRRIVVYSFLIFMFMTSCEEKVNEYNGFTQGELEYLLAGDELKAWNLTGKEESGTEITLNDCESDNYLIFVQGDLGTAKPLLYAYNPSICDSLDFCLQNPEFCISDTTLCGADPETCASLSEGILYIGSWYAKAPFIENDPSDTLTITINNIKESVYVPYINPENVNLQYKSRTGTNGGVITEYYYFPLPVSQ